jgi:hypothetical protein
VRIISSFLSRGKHEIGGECKSLTALSNSSRIETLEALGQLYSRLSTLDLHACGGCTSRNQAHATQHEYRKPRASASPTGRRPARRSKTDDKNVSIATVTRLAVEGSSNTQLAIVRPRNRRTTSSCSGSSVNTTKSFSSTTTAVPTPPMSPAAPPCCCHGPVDLHGHVPRVPLERRIDGGQVSTLRPTGYVERPQTWPNRVDSQARPAMYPAPPGALLVKPPPVEVQKKETRPRRRQIETPSTYSFASDSTKLGEIPMHKWTKPFDYDEMERLNSLTETMESVGISNQAEQAKESGKKKGLWKLFKGKAQE